MKFTPFRRPTAVLVLAVLAGAGATRSAKGALEAENRNSRYASLSPNLEYRDVSDLERKIVAAFNREGCPGARSLANPHHYDRLGSLARAVIAYCQDNTSVAEALFRQAEALDPSRDTIYLLHARYRWKRNPESAIELWDKVLLYARSNSMKLLARSYLDGTADGSEAIVLEDQWYYYTNLTLSGGYDTNPLLKSLSDASTRETGLGTAQVETGLQRKLGNVTLAANYDFAYTRYYSARAADLWVNTLEVPVSFSAGTNEDLKLRPLGGYQQYGESPYYLYGGLAIAGVAYRGDYRQSVQGTVYYDKFYQRALQQQQGTHFRFDYSWEVYPGAWFARLLAYVEHVQAGRDRDTTRKQTLSYSHNDIGLQGFAEYNFRWMIVGLSTQIVVREDNNASTYLAGDGLSEQRTKRREDLLLVVSPSIAVPIGSGFHLLASYKWQRRFSNIGLGDYDDKNFEQQVVLLSLRASFTNF